MDIGEFLEHARTKHGQTAMAEHEILFTIFNQYTRQNRGKLLELGCGSYSEGLRPIHEDRYAPKDVENRKGYWEITGVDRVPLGRNAEGWRFIQGDLLDEETWARIGSGYDLVNTNMLFSFSRYGQVSPSFGIGAANVFVAFGEQKPVKRILENPDYFRCVDFMLRMAHGALKENGLMAINYENLLRKKNGFFVPEIGQVKRDAWIRSLPWTVPWAIEIPKVKAY